MKKVIKVEPVEGSPELKSSDRISVSIKHLDAIISVGYRVDSKQATQFRIWATTALCNATTRELREGHNLEKMYISGEFEKYEYDALYEAALSRERADWIVGINATRLFSVLYNQTLNIDRVMTPRSASGKGRD